MVTFSLLHQVWLVGFGTFLPLTGTIGSLAGPIDMLANLAGLGSLASAGIYYYRSRRHLLSSHYLKKN